jgi:hypothetical protein
MKAGITLVLFLYITNHTAAQQPATDTVCVPASNQYREPSLLNIILIGTNYRKEWGTPVALPVFKPTGLTITELGGGMQTRSLYFKDRYNEEWVLRTVDKDPREAVPAIIKNKITVQALQQVISAAHPYAPLTIPVLAKAIGVTVAKPVFYWVPGDTAFGKYRALFANTVCLLEKKNIVSKEVKTIETEELIKNIHAIDQQAYLRARLLDMLIADWDRHPDQWIWAKRGNRVEALPKDRDQAFFHSHGLLVTIASVIKLKHLVGFTKNARNIKRLNYKSWNMDRLFLNELTGNDWESISAKFHKNLSDSVITEAVNKLPSNISGEKIKRKLINRRNQMVKSLPRYYRFLAKSVTVPGTSGADVFDVKNDGDSVMVTLTSKKAVIYKRTFCKKETKKIHLIGLGGGDVYNCEEPGIEVAIDKTTDAALYEEYLRTYLRIKE